MNSILVSKPSDWPIHVSDLSALLSRPLPDWVKNGPYRVVTDETKALLPCSNPRLHVGDRRETLDRVFDLTLQTCLSLRSCQLLNETHPDIAQLTWPSMYLLFSALGLGTMPEASILTDVPVIRPRSSKQSAEERASFSTAQMLISYNHVPERPECCVPDTCTPTPHHDDISSDESFYGTDDNSAISETSSALAPSVGYSLEIHSVAGRGRRLSILIPGVCVADSDNIVPVLSAALYQRHVLGINLPIVGLKVERYGTSCQTIFGWLDHSEKNSDGLPLVCTAYATERSTQLGFFELTDTISILSFVQFMLCLQTHFKQIAEAAPETEHHFSEVCWRSDLTHKENLLDIEAWRLDVYANSSNISPTSSPSIPDSPPFPTTPSLPICQQSRPILMADYDKESQDVVPPLADDYLPHVRARSTESLPKKRKLRSEGISKSDAQSQSAILTMKTSQKNRSLAISGSEYAGLTQNTKGLSDEPSAPNFIFERGAVRIVNALPMEDAPQYHEIEKYTKEYNEAFRMFVPKDWLEPGGKPFADKDFEHHISPLIDGLKDLLDRKTTYIDVVDMSSPAKSVEESEKRAILSTVVHKLGIVLAAVDGSSWRHDQRTYRAPNEAEYRSEWDTLLRQFSTSTKRGTQSLTSVLFEPTVKHARNPMLESKDVPEAMKDARKKHSCYYDLLNSQLNRAVKDGKDEGPALQITARAAIERTFLWQRETADVKKTLEKLKLRSIKEPCTAKCDAIVVTFMQSPLEEIDPSQLGMTASKFHSTLSFVNDVGPEKKATQENDARHTPDNIFSFNCSRANSTEASRLQFNPSPIAGASTLPYSTADILVPILLAEYKKTGLDNIIAVGHQSRTTMVSLLRWLALCGVKDFMLYGVLVEAVKGSVYGAWYSSRDDQIYIMDINVNTFDIAIPVEAFQFSLFFARIQHSIAKRIQTKLEAARSYLTESFKTPHRLKEFMYWHNQAQYDKFEEEVRSYLRTSDKETVKAIEITSPSAVSVSAKMT